MSQKEFQRVKVIENAVGGRLSVSEAARLLQLSERQVQQLKRRYRPDSVASVHHGNRGTAHALGSARGPAADDPGTGPRQVSRLQRFSSLPETAQRRASVRSQGKAVGVRGAHSSKTATSGAAAFLVTYQGKF